MINTRAPDGANKHRTFFYNRFRKQISMTKKQNIFLSSLSKIFLSFYNGFDSIHRSDNRTKQVELQLRPISHFKKSLLRKKFYPPMPNGAMQYNIFFIYNKKRLI